MTTSWKGPATNSIVPSHAYNNITNGSAYIRMARPIKHWRKQLIPTTVSSSSGRAGIGMPMDTPGGAVYVVNCQPYPTATGIKENIEKYDNTNFIKTPGVCVVYNPVMRRASSKMSNTYYSDTKSYLRSRGNTYDQKLSANKAPDIIYFANGKPVPPSNTPTGSQIRLTQSCGLKCQIPTVQKPNNLPFFTQAAVDSSSKIERLKLDTLNKTPAPLLSDGKPKKMGVTHIAIYNPTRHRLG